MPSRFRVLSAGSSAPGCAGSGICLTQTITFIVALIVTDDVTASPNPRDPWPRGFRYVRRLADPAGRELVRLVGDRPQHRRRPPPAEPRPRGRAGRDEPARPRHPLRPRRRPARPRRRRRLRRRRHAQRGGRRASPAPTPRSAPCPAGRPTCSPARIGLPNDPVEAADLLADGIDAGDLRPIGLGRVNGRYFCFHTGVGYDAAVVAAVERHASLKRWLGHPMFITAAVATWARGYDRQAARTSGSSPTTGRRGRLLLDRAQHQPVHVPRQPPARPVATPRRSTGGWSPSRSAR